MKIVIKSTHLDSVGGGENNTIYLAKAFSEFGQISWDCEIHPRNQVFSGIKNQWKKYDNSFRPDIYIYMSHFGDTYPKGKKNLKFCFYPHKNNKPFWLWKWKYDGAICLNEFVAKAQEKIWGLPSFIVNPCIDTTKFKIAEKEEMIINVGNLFLEKNGHSKNQHLVLDWFKENKLYKKYKLVFIGHIVDHKYFDELKKNINIPNVEVYFDIPFNQLVEFYSKAKYLVHAMGYGRTLEHEVEHFGMVAIEALASGCQPIVYNSGGCKDIQGVRAWEKWEDILSLMTESDPVNLQGYSKEYDYSQMVRQVGGLIKQLF